MDFDIIALDVDGTLINDQFELTEGNKEAVRKAHKLGAKIVLCTGRGPASTLPLLKELELEGYSINHNGAATIHSRGSEEPVLVHEFAFSVNQIELLVRYCREHGVHFDVSTAFHMYVEKLTEEEKTVYEKFFLTPELYEDVLKLEIPLVKFTLAGEVAQVDRIEKEWTESRIYGDLTMMRSGEFFIDVMHTDASKGNALKALAERWDVPPERIMAIGNYFNDLEMLAYAGFGVAMDNSPDAVKKAARVVTGSNNEDGVREALMKYVL